MLTAELLKLLLYIGGPILGLLFVAYKSYSAGKAGEQAKQNEALRKIEEGLREAEKRNATLDYERDKQTNAISDLKSDELLRLFNKKLWGRDSSKPSD